MTPLIVIPARQMSQGRPCKNREAWPALAECLSSIGAYGHVGVVVTDDPWVTTQRAPKSVSTTLWRHMDSQHTMSQLLRDIVPGLPCDVVVVLQPSSPTKRRDAYVRIALDHLSADTDHTSVISVVPWEGEPPSKACTLNPDGTLAIPPTPEPRQLQPQHYRRDGTVYAVRRQYAEQGDLYGPRPIPLLIDPKDSVTLD